MRKTIYILFTLLITVYGKLDAQCIPDTISGTKYIIYPSFAMFPTGEKGMMKFISDNLKYPKNDICIEGRVVIRFLVKDDGMIDSVKVLRGIHPDFDNEALRVVKLMPRWIPAKLNGKGIENWFTLPITFKIKEDE